MDNIADKHDKSQCNFMTPKIKMRKRSSFFNLDIAEDTTATADQVEYEQKLENENKDWTEVIRSMRAKIKE
jgi:hypothetical protein